MPLDHPHVVDQWRRISSGGQSLGVHPGYETYDQPERVASATRLVRQQMEKLGIEQEELGGRQHYLRWETAGTARAYEEAGLSHDATLGFADHAGFRAGICYEYPWYDVQERRPLSLRERPLVLMDVTLTRPGYMDLGAGESFDYAVALKSECRKYGGDFSVLWHNNVLQEETERELYQQLLRA